MTANAILCRILVANSKHEIKYFSSMCLILVSVEQYVFMGGKIFLTFYNLYANIKGIINLR